MTERAPYATLWENSKGRLVDEPAAQNRSPFQRDRDRIIHSDAFRRLQYKTQVFVNHEGDHYRTRLTHTIEVAQITRDICHALKLDADLGETVALAHDMGHPPFGHAGEDALNEAAEKWGGFRHNVQTLRIVRGLERRYPGFDGLNLAWESLEGIAKHNGPLTDPREAHLKIMSDLDPAAWCGLEAQVAALADDIAYNHHDLDDGLRAGILHLDEVMEHIPHFKGAYKQVEAKYPHADTNRLTKAAISHMIGAQVQDLLRTTTHNLQAHNIKTVEDVRRASQAMVAFSGALATSNKAHKKYMFEHVYRHYRVNRMALKAHHVLKDLFHTFFEHRRCLPPDVQARLPEDRHDDKGKARVVADYISGMTDRFALQEHQRLINPMERT